MPPTSPDFDASDRISWFTKQSRRRGCAARPFSSLTTVSSLPYRAYAHITKEDSIPEDLFDNGKGLDVTVPDGGFHDRENDNQDGWEG